MYIHVYTALIEDIMLCRQSDVINSSRGQTKETPTICNHLHTNDSAYSSGHFTAILDVHAWHILSAHVGKPAGRITFTVCPNINLYLLAGNTWVCGTIRKCLISDCSPQSTSHWIISCLCGKPTSQNNRQTRRKFQG